MVTKNHGGARPGAGRKKTTVRYFFNLDNDLAESLNNMPKSIAPNKSRFINQAIREKLEREKDV